jgi:hypothetical protein
MSAARGRRYAANYGSLDGGAGGIWNVRQAFYVSGGMRYARAMPEIYSHALAASGRTYRGAASISTASPSSLPA